MATGREIKLIYDAMKEVCRELSRMLIAIRDDFQRHGFLLAHPNSSVMWDTASSFSEPDKWLPYFQQMRFRSEALEEFDRAVAVNVFLDAFYLKHAIPFVSCGYISLDEKKMKEFSRQSNEMFDAGWLNGEISVSTPPLFETKFTNRVCKSIVNYFLPLDVIDSEVRVNSLIVEPLVLLYEGKRQDTIDAIKQFAITMDTIKDFSQK